MADKKEITKTQDELFNEASEAIKQGAEARAASFESEADIDRRLTAMLEKDYEADKAREEQELNLRRSFQSLTDMAGVFGDMIRASGGAVVSPRDIEQHYNRLDDRQKQVYDNYRARIDLMRRKQAEGAMDREKQARAGAQHDADKEFQLRLAMLKQKQDEEAEDARFQHQRRLYGIMYGGKNKPDDKYFIDFGNGETKSYRNNTKEGMNAFASIYQYLEDNGLIPEEAHKTKDGEIIPVTTQEQADFYVRAFLPKAMENPYVKNDIYKMVMGRSKDFKSPLERGIDSYSVNKPQVNYLLGGRPNEAGFVVSGQQTPKVQTSSGMFYNKK